LPNYRLVGIFVPSKQSHVIFEFVNIYKDKGLFRFFKLSDSSEIRFKNSSGILQHLLFLHAKQTARSGGKKTKQLL